MPPEVGENLEKASVGITQWLSSLSNTASNIDMVVLYWIGGLLIALTTTYLLFTEKKHAKKPSNLRPFLRWVCITGMTGLSVFLVANLAALLLG